MGQYDIDKDLYIKWFEEKTIAIEQLDRNGIEERITEISKMEFFARREWAMLHERFDKLTGRKSIPPWLKGERDKLITDPNFKVDFEPKEVRPKKEKGENVKSLLGIDINELTKNLKKKGKDDVASLKKATGLDILTREATLPEKVEVTQEQIQDKAAILKEKMRLAREGKG